MGEAKNDRERRRSAPGSEEAHGDDPQAARHAILTRRARFIAAALASAGLAGGGAACTCLSVAPQPSEAPTVNTEPTTAGSSETAAVGETFDAGAPADGGADGGASDGAPLPRKLSPGAQICLSDDPINGELIKPRPRNCLDFDPDHEKLLLQGPQPDVCLEAPFDDGMS